MPDPVDYVARLRAEREDAGREETLRRDRSRRRLKRGLVGGTAAAALVGFAVWLVSSTSGERPADEPFAAGTRPESLWPDAWPATTNLPFRGSHAADWATDDSGIQVPDVKAVNGIPEERVFDALNRTKDFLIAANLDQAVLHGGWPTKALKMLDAQDSARARLIRHLREPGAQGGDPTEMFTRFDPAELRVVEDGVRVHGRMTFEAGNEPGRLRVRADYTFVYAVGRAAPGAEPGPWGGTEEVARAVVRRQLVLDLDERAAPGKLVPLEYRRLLGNHDCRTTDGFVHPYFSREAARADRPWPVVDPYDSGKDIADDRVCIVPSRT
ncbi:hypothetical protein ACIA8E_03320 [Streptomyces sp. NPDC051664]|uniref:hypothetical protein n=1 Tax=Streptomyces sp. NPDC051664 TaxID=3365668 RepID=UPI0037A1ADC0